MQWLLSFSVRRQQEERRQAATQATEDPPSEVAAESAWTVKPQLEKTQDEEMDSYFEDLFM